MYKAYQFSFNIEKYFFFENHPSASLFFTYAKSWFSHDAAQIQVYVRLRHYVYHISFQIAVKQLTKILKQQSKKTYKRYENIYSVHNLS